MDWTDNAIILSVRRQGEGSLILSLLTETHGRHRGLVRGAAKSRQRGLYEPGNVVSATWRARLDEHLGQSQIEPLRAVGSMLFDDPLRLSCLEAALGLSEMGLPERVPHQLSFEALQGLLDHLARDDGYAPAHLRFELSMLADLGFGLDLSACAVTGVATDLAFVSPKTGRAVSSGAGESYKDRLLVLPRLLGGTGRMGNEITDLLDGLTLTGHFLSRHVPGLTEGLPAARQRYTDRLIRANTTD